MYAFEILVGIAGGGSCISQKQWSSRIPVVLYGTRLVMHPNVIDVIWI